MNKNMNFQNEELYYLLLKLTKMILDIIQNSPPEYITYTTENIWTRDDDFNYTRQITNRFYWPITILKLSNDIEKTKTYKDALACLNADDIISPQLDTLVGTSFSKRRIIPSEIAYKPTYSFLTNEGVKNFNIDTFNKIYKKIEQNLYSDEVEYELLTPLFGFYSECSHYSINDITAIVKMSSDEIINLLENGIKLGASFGPMDFIHNVQDFALKTKLSYKKIIGENISIKEKSSTNKKVKTEEEPLLIDALRLFKSGLIYPITTQTKVKSLFAGAGSSIGYGKPIVISSSKSYQLNIKELDEFKSFWEIYCSKPRQNKNFLSVGIRRFSQSNEREDIEDRIIDLMIAAESIFLSSSSDNQGELRYRLSLRAGMFLSNDPKEQKDIYNFMRKAYDIRSSIVHGASPSLPTKPSGEKFTIYEFCSQLELHLRNAIKKIITDPSSHIKETSVDWDSVIFLENPY